MSYSECANDISFVPSSNSLTFRWIDEMSFKYNSFRNSELPRNSELAVPS